jgi:rfaE bifunctional protein kinase chain/domain
MTGDELKSLLDRFSSVRIGVLGDYCVDAYWLLDDTEVENSLETGKRTHAVCRQSYSLGGAGNVANNVSALGVAEVCAFGVIGNDMFGREMLDLLKRAGVETAGIIIQSDGWDTCAYTKPYVDLDEQERIDFGRFNRITKETAAALLGALEKAMPSLDGLIINQQIRRGIHSDYLVTHLQEIIDQHGNKVVLMDARDVFDRYRNVISKLNAAEAARMCGHNCEIAQAIPVPDLIRYARSIFKRTGKEVIITRSDRGMLAFDGQHVFEAPGILHIGQIDPVGAGDTAAVAITSTLAVGGTLAQAIAVGNYAAGVVVRKLRMTGTASQEEIVDLAATCDQVHRPEVSEDIRKAEYVKDTEIEIIAHDAVPAPIRHVLLDHDGTISILRQGWEQIMEPIMVRAILGRRYDDAPEELYQRVLKRVHEYIDQSAGIETIIQMQTLVHMVKQFGQVPEEEILNAAGYKEIYNRALMDMVEKRIQKLQRGELEPADFTVAGSIELLGALHKRGIKLYLASGTDHADVLHEATMLGYADCFEGRIYGWAGVTTASAKKMVIERILRENYLSGRALACIGDGPVELRLCKKAGGLAIGVASDEVRRYGLNPAKRTRLIKAGADILVPDFTQHPRLLQLVFGS